MKTIMVTGANGFLGRSLLTNLIELKEFNINLLIEDITNPELQFESPDVLIHLAAKHPSNPGDILKVNYEATKNLAALCSKDTHFIFLSTDYVFKEDNTKEYNENSKKEPETEYGVSKSLAEEHLKETLKNLTIIRTSMLYGYYNEKRNNFIQFLLKQLANNKRVELFTDIFSHPTHVDDLSNFIIEVIKNKKLGTFHACTDDFVSRFELGNLFCQVNHLNSELLVPIERANNSELPKNINLKPSHQFLEISKIPLRDGLKYDIKYTGEQRAS